MDQITQFMLDNKALIASLLTLAGTLATLIKSEVMALNPSTPTSGIVQGWLIKKGLAVVPIVAADLASHDTAAQIVSDMAAAITVDGAPAPSAAELAVKLTAQLAAEASSQP